jgi:ATP-dependent DNA helicase PIF1
VKTAFTGAAASNIEGQTLHSSFGFNFDNKHYSLSDKTRDEKRTLFKNLKIVIIDEVSMVKSDMLYQLDLKLQELKERVGVPFGGVAVIDLGDILQLRPVLGAFAFEKPKNPEFHATFQLHNRWEMFRVLNLEVNHRQGEDKPYAETLNRIRIGEMNEEDIAQLKTRVRPKSHPDLKEVSLYIVPTRKTCTKYNLGYLKSLQGDEIKLNARHYHATQKKYTPFIDKKEGAIGTTAFQDELRLKISANIIIIHNIDTSDGLTNGQLGELIDIIKTKDGEADKLIVKLKKKGLGEANRRKFPGLAIRYPESVVIERVTINYSLRKKGGAVGSTATLVQFPVKLAHAITAHKIQGQTIPKPLKVAFDIDSVFEEAQGYVMLSRVQELEQVYIINKFNPNKLYPSKKALRELERMNRVSINENPDPWSKKSENTLKIVSLNCSGLKAHFQDIQTDDRLQKANIIHLVECSLTEEDNALDFILEGYNQQLIRIGPGKGIATYFNSDIFTPAQEVKKDKFQITKFKHKAMDIINVYRSQTGNSLELLEKLKNLIEAGRITIITGDFNICYMENFSNRMTQGLLSMGFDQLVHEPTHIRGRHIDQVYFLDPSERLKPIVDRYSPYYSDHDGICITISELFPQTEEQ